MARSKLFISYSHHDHRWLVQIRKQLDVLAQQVAVFDDSDIGAGEIWYARLGNEMEGARVALLLISANSLTSQFILSEEVPRLLAIQRDGGMTVYPFLVSECAWDEVRWLRDLQMAPRVGREKVVRSLESLQVPARNKSLADLARNVALLARSPTQTRTRDGAEYNIVGLLEIVQVSRNEFMLASGESRRWTLRHEPAGFGATEIRASHSGEISRSGLRASKPWIVRVDLVQDPESQPLPMVGTWRLRLFFQSIGHDSDLVVHGPRIPSPRIDFFSCAIPIHENEVPPGDYVITLVAQHLNPGPTSHSIFVGGPAISVAE